MVAVALTIAGSDPSGGAGIQADLKTFHRFGVYGEAVITLITVQNTKHVARVEVLDAELVIQQIEAVVSDIPPGAAKTGALGNAAVVRAVAAVASAFDFPLVVDPVMVSKHGHRLLTEEAEEAMRKDLIPRAALLTPNVPEAEALAGIAIRTERDMNEAGQRLLDLGCKAVLIKGGHLAGEPIDFFSKGDGYFGVFHTKRIETPHTHGTGCTHSAAITALLAQRKDLQEAVMGAKEFVTKAISSAPGLGGGQGPVNHFA
jgi:hydroxymethylpyrimidine/phosphomethylpyrimidine kinase